MFKNFVPNYQNLVDAAYNRKPARIPIYDHSIDVSIMERITNKEFRSFSSKDIDTFFKHYNNFCKFMGYDAVVFEGCVTHVLPGGGALGGHKPGCISTMDDFNNYPWHKIKDLYFERFTPSFKALGNQMPEGMKAIGGVGNGVFECVQDLTGYMDLCYIAVDSPELYTSLFQKVGDVLYDIWQDFLNEFGDTYCVCRFGDDLGFHSATLLSETDVKELIVPQYKRIVSAVHDAGKPFLLHSCGAIFNVMDEIIDVAKINAKHSNEDSIAPFKQWIELYGDKIGNFGGIDTDVLCASSTVELVAYVTDIMNIAMNKNGGVAIGSGNSIPNYVDPNRYINAVNIIRAMRGDN